MKTCTKCHILKNKSEFYFKNISEGILHSQCKQCYKEQRARNYHKHYEMYKTVYRDRANRRRHQILEKYRKKMLAYLSNKCCDVCQESDVIVLEFDHINPSTKRFAVSQGVRLGYDWEEILSEIQKCRILCSNCRKRRTAKQYGWYKLS